MGRPEPVTRSLIWTPHLASVSSKSTFLTPNLLGSLWMISAMGAFALEDTFLKSAASQLPVAEILVLFGLGGALVFGLLAIVNRERILTPPAFAPVMLIRFFSSFWGVCFLSLHLP